jgi:hypothetical protein
MSRFSTVKFEDVFSAVSGFRGLRAICELVGLEVSKDQLEQFGARPVNAARKQVFPRWEDWPADLREKLVAVCGSEAVEYGYDTEG